MARSATVALGRYDRALYWTEQAVIVVAASLFVAICARITVPLPFTPVPLTMENFAVLLMGLTLGSRRG
ncbi:MAG TPA: biotin transporter BioY, partial [Terriglobales bacterium]